MKIVKPAELVKCPICKCEMEITSKDVWTEMTPTVSVWSETHQPGKRFVTCPICHTKVYLNGNNK